MTESARLGLPHIDAGQVEKSTTHNEALALLDIAVCAAVDGYLANSPPAAPVVGSAYVLGPSPTGDWTGQAGSLAGFTAGGWRFIPPVDGLEALDKASGATAVFRGGQWTRGELIGERLSIAGTQLVGPQLPAISNPTGGATIDMEARSAIAAILDRLRDHGLIGS